jgi:hypothetical protein
LSQKIKKRPTFLSWKNLNGLKAENGKRALLKKRATKNEASKPIHHSLKDLNSAKINQNINKISVVKRTLFVDFKDKKIASLTAYIVYSSAPKYATFTPGVIY